MRLISSCSNNQVTERPATGIQLAVGVLEGGNRESVMRFMPRHLLIDVELITPDNAERYYFPESVF